MEKRADSRTGLCEASDAIYLTFTLTNLQIRVISANPWQSSFRLLQRHTEALCIPECLRRQNHWSSAADRRRNCGKGILVDQEDEWFLFDHDFLHAVESFFPFFRIAGRGLRPHQTVDLGLPWSFWSLLLRIPLVILRRTQPHVHLTVRIEIDVGESQNDRLVVERLSHALNQGREVERNHIYVDADLLQIILDQHRHALAYLVSGVRDNRKHNLIAV